MAQGRILMTLEYDLVTNQMSKIMTLSVSAQNLTLLTKNKNNVGLKASDVVIFTIEKCFKKRFRKGRAFLHT